MTATDNEKQPGDANKTPTYNMKDLADEVAKEFGLTLQRGMDVTRFIFGRIKTETALGKQVRMHKVGTWQAHERAAGVARNPATGERIDVAARRVVKFTVAPAFKDEIKSTVPVIAPVPAAADSDDDV